MKILVAIVFALMVSAPAFSQPPPVGGIPVNANCEGQGGGVHLIVPSGGYYDPVFWVLNGDTIPVPALLGMDTLVSLDTGMYYLVVSLHAGQTMGIWNNQGVWLDCYASPNCAGQIMHTNGLGAVNWYVDGSYVSTGDSLDLSSYIGDTASVEAFSAFDTTVVAWMGDVYPRHGAEIMSVMDDFCFSSSGSASVGLILGWGTPQTTFLWSNGDSSWSATGLSAGTYTVAVDNGLGCVETLSVVVGDTCNISTGVTDHEDSPSLSVYPNPTTDRVNITSTQDVVSGEILNTLGQTVMILPRLTGQDTSLDVSDLERGQYFIRLQVGNRFVTERLVIN